MNNYDYLNKINTFVCKRLRLHEYLSSKNYIAYKTLPDKNNPAYDVWLYYINDELRRDLIMYFQRIEQK